jgi:5-methylcytosine-specific restriction endonuclease McrA
LFVAFGSVVGKDRFPTERENARRHGARLAFGAQVDHVTPFNLGGETTLENLVASCWSCNYGKARYHIDQIAIADPRERAPSSEAWDGFVPLLAQLRAVAAQKSA